MPAPEPVPDPVRIAALATGGEGVGRLADGRVCFVAGTLPGELVTVAIRQAKARWVRASLGEVLEASPERVEPPCRWQRAGCGGCDLMHAPLATQRSWRVRLVAESLQRLGRLADPVVEAGPPLPGEAVRTTVRLAVLDGRPALRRRASHELQAIDRCLVLHPALDELLATARFGAGVHEVTLRVGAATGERLAVLHPSAGRGAAVLPSDVLVVGADELRAHTGRGGPGAASDQPVAVYHEVVAGRRWRISAGSFFQSSAAGAEALVAEVRAAVRDTAGPAPARVLDAYCGVGLLSAAVSGSGVELVAVESNASSVADAAVNLADVEARIVQSRVERWRPEPVDLVVADPARRGLAAAGAATLAGTGAGAIVLVSCDMASLGRDAAELDRLGYRHRRSVVLDLFPHTSHAEVVTRFERR
ncbi:MAG: TRAM domain-containing protein [Acidimicrobiales bacterium]